MPTIRAQTVDVVARVRAQLALDAQAAAGNTTLSKAEQAALPDGDALKRAATDMRTGGARTVHIDALVDAASSFVNALVGRANTRATATLSATEVKKVAAMDADVGARVATAYELITGKHIDLTAPTPLPTPPPTVGALAVSNLVVTSAFPMGFQAQVVNNALVVKGMAATPGTLDVDVAGRTVHLDFPAGIPSRNGTGGGFDPRDVVEALRKALPANLGLRVASYTRGALTVDFWPNDTVPAVANAPQYGVFEWSRTDGNPRMRGPVAMDMTSMAVNAGDKLSFRVDDAIYTATAQTSSATTASLGRDLKAQMEADGRTVVFKDYGSMRMWSLRVTG